MILHTLAAPVGLAFAMCGTKQIDHLVITDDNEKTPLKNDIFTLYYGYV